MTDTMDPATETMNGTMKAVSQDELGGPDVLKLVTVPTPEPAACTVCRLATSTQPRSLVTPSRRDAAFTVSPMAVNSRRFTEPILPITASPV